MKKYAFVIISCLGLGLLSCNEQNVSPDTALSATSDLATSGGGQRPGGKDGQRPPKLDEIAITNLPATITDYIAQNYSGYTIEKAGTDSLKNYIVGISNSTDKKGLRFDAAGKFVEELKRPAEGNGQGNPPQLTEVAVSALPQTISNYVTTNYAGATIEKAGKDSDGNYFVLILKDSKPLGLLFNSSGSFQKELPPPPKKG